MNSDLFITKMSSPCESIPCLLTRYPDFWTTFRPLNQICFYLVERTEKPADLCYLYFHLSSVLNTQGKLFALSVPISGILLS